MDKFFLLIKLRSKTRRKERLRAVNFIKYDVQPHSFRFAASNLAARNISTMSNTFETLILKMNENVSVVLQRVLTIYNGCLSSPKKKPLLSLKAIHFQNKTCSICSGETSQNHENRFNRHNIQMSYCYALVSRSLICVWDALLILVLCMSSRGENLNAYSASKTTCKSSLVPIHRPHSDERLDWPRRECKRNRAKIRI